MKRNKLNDVAAAWLAGIVDGEGCIYINKRQRHNCSPHYSVTLTVGNTNGKIVNMCLSIAGLGRIAEEKSMRVRHPEYRPFYYWRVVSRQASTVLERIGPYLVAKQRQAVIAVAIQAHNSQYQKGRFLTHKEIKLKDRLYTECRKLN